MAARTETATPPPPRRHSGARRPLLGEILVERGVLTEEQLSELLTKRSGPDRRLGHLAVDRGYATEAQICEAIAYQLQIPAADMVAVDATEDALARVSHELARKHIVLPWFVEDERFLYLIMADPTNLAAADAIAFHSGLRVKPVVAPESELIAAIVRFYASEEDSLAQFDQLDLAGQVSIVAGEEADGAPVESPEAAAQSGAVVKLLNAILADAIRSGASDVHIEPREKAVELRYRVDGMLRLVMTMPKRLQTRLLSRIKITSKLDIAERRKPQDGRAFIRVAGKNYDLRVSTLPVSDGEKAVLRILVQDRAQSSLAEMGFDPDLLQAFQEFLRRPQGMILVTGPTGSGKTSTLYAALNFLRQATVNIVTIEDPVEYRLSGINQVAVSEKSGLTFAAGLRSILRQDPDVVMIGEIRDLETATVAFQAAQTGHLVLATLHTNDTPSAVTRLVEMGVPAYVVASSMLVIQAQRLARVLCSCKRVAADGTATPTGCEACRFSGFRGRVGLHELLPFTSRVRTAVVARASEDVVWRAARGIGARSLYEDGLEKVRRGLTTLDELRRVVPPDDRDQVDPQDGASDLSTLPIALSPGAHRNQRPRVLVVDDDPTLLEVIHDVLVSEHYEVHLAADGEAALAAVYRERPDLILTDLQMPGMNGLELLKRVRHDLSICQIPVVFLTVVDSIDSEVQALDLGADDYITKPVQRDRLLGRVRRALFNGHLLRTP